VLYIVRNDGMLKYIIHIKAVKWMGLQKAFVIEWK